MEWWGGEGKGGIVIDSPQYFFSKSAPMAASCNSRCRYDWTVIQLLMFRCTDSDRMLVTAKLS